MVCFIQYFGFIWGACLHSTEGFGYLRSLFPGKQRDFLVPIDHTCIVTIYPRKIRLFVRHKRNYAQRANFGGILGIRLTLTHLKS